MNTVAIGATANANFQNQINVSVVFNYLKQHGPTYRAEIARNLGLSAPAVSRAIDQLTEHGYVRDVGTMATESGKKVTQIAINPRMGSVVAVDLLKGDSRYGIFDFDGEMIYSRKGLRYAESGDLVSDLIADLDRFLLQAGSVWERSGHDGTLPAIKAFCIGIPAAVDPETGRTTGTSLFESLNKVNLKEEVQRRFDIRCYVENDVKLAAFAENRFGQGTRHRDLIYLDINDGIGAGIILDNRIVRGAQGFAGEIGYFLSSPNEMEYASVTRGYLENRASVEALGRSAAEAIRRGVKTEIVEYLDETCTTPRPRHVFEAAMADDQLARTLVTHSIDLIAVAIHNVILMVNPEVVVIGGDICEMPGVDTLFVHPIRMALARALPFPPPDIVLSSLGADACITGASAFAVESLLSGEYPFTMNPPKNT